MAETARTTPEEVEFTFQVFPGEGAALRLKSLADGREMTCYLGPEKLRRLRDGLDAMLKKSFAS